MKRISLLILSLLFFATAFQSDKLLTSGWYIQSFPNMNGSSITSITFLDSLTGFAVTNTNSSLQAYILKTTNGGDNWNINYTYTQTNSNWNFVKIGFVDLNTGYAFGWSELFKTTNGGINWNIIITDLYAEDVSIINKDTMIAVSSSGLDGGVYRSTNGGISWQTIWGGGGNGMPSRIYMYDKNLGFTISNNGMRRTTNGGFNWTIIPNEAFQDIKFRDTLNGWRCNSDVKRTTDGGITWTIQQLPQNPNFTTNGISKISDIYNGNLWGVGGTILNPTNNKFYGILYKTTNGGVNWGYQLTDTAINIGRYYNINFINKNIGWAYRFIDGVHTLTNGNDTTFFTGIKLVPNIVPEKFSLGQNYPNPFNPATNIPFELKEPSHVTLKVFDSRGREVKELVNGRWGTGKFIADFDVHHGGSATIASGIYFYQIIVSGESSHQTFTETRKMMFLK